MSQNQYRSFREPDFPQSLGAVLAAVEADTSTHCHLCSDDLIASNDGPGKSYRVVSGWMRVCEDCQDEVAL